MYVFYLPNMAVIFVGLKEVIDRFSCEGGRWTVVRFLCKMRCCVDLLGVGDVGEEF